MMFDLFMQRVMKRRAELRFGSSSSAIVPQFCEGLCEIVVHG